MKTLCAFCASCFPAGQPAQPTADAVESSRYSTSSHPTSPRMPTWYRMDSPGRLNPLQAAARAHHGMLELVRKASSMNARDVQRSWLQAREGVCPTTLQICTSAMTACRQEQMVRMGSATSASSSPSCQRPSTVPDPEPDPELEQEGRPAYVPPPPNDRPYRRVLFR